MFTSYVHNCCSLLLLAAIIASTFALGCACRCCSSIMLSDYIHLLPHFIVSSVEPLLLSVSISLHCLHLLPSIVFFSHAIAVVHQFCWLLPLPPQLHLLIVPAAAHWLCLLVLFTTASCQLCSPIAIAHSLPPLLNKYVLGHLHPLPLPVVLNGCIFQLQPSSASSILYIKSWSPLQHLWIHKV